MAWTVDPDRGAVEVLAFIVRFGLLPLAIARLPRSEQGFAWLCRLLLAIALVFAAVGIAQWATRTVFWNHKVIADNTYASFYRVNSLFWDPSIYGRFLVIAILVALAIMVFGPWRQYDLALGLMIVVLWVGLFFSFSQSSFAALIPAVVLAGVLAWRRRGVAVGGGSAALFVLMGVGPPAPAGAPGTLSAGADQELNRATRGRFELVTNGLRIAADHPVVGVGVGGFTK